jgi:hypothetical protein
MKNEHPMSWNDTRIERPPEGVPVLCIWLERQFPENQRVIVWTGSGWDSPPADYPRYIYEAPDAWRHLPDPPTTSGPSAWIRAADSKPPIGTEALCWWPGKYPADDGGISVAVWDGELWTNPEEADFGYVDPHFWMMLPEAPTLDPGAP